MAHQQKSTELQGAALAHVLVGIHTFYEDTPVSEASVTEFRRILGAMLREGKIPEIPEDVRAQYPEINALLDETLTYIQQQQLNGLAHSRIAQTIVSLGRYENPEGEWIPKEDGPLLLALLEKDRTMRQSFQPMNGEKLIPKAAVPERHVKTKTPASLDVVQNSLVQDALNLFIQHHAQGAPGFTWLSQRDAEKRVLTEDILRNVVSYYGISGEDIQGQDRHRAVVWPRQVAMYLAKQLTDHTLVKIGQQIGKRDHTTVLHGIRKIENILENEEDGRLKSELGTLTEWIAHGEPEPTTVPVGLNKEILASESMLAMYNTFWKKISEMMGYNTGVSIENLKRHENWPILASQIFEAFHYTFPQHSSGDLIRIMSVFSHNMKPRYWAAIQALSDEMDKLLSKSSTPQPER